MNLSNVWYINYVYILFLDYKKPLYNNYYRYIKVSIAGSWDGYR